LTSHILWLVEALYYGSKDFRRNYALGIWDGFYWAGVTTSTVGYGDKAPKTSFGKCITLSWMLFGFFFTMIVSATVTSLITIEQLTPPPLSIEDFRAMYVGVPKHFPLINDILSINGIPIEYNTLQEGYQSLLNNTSRFFIADQASMAILNTTQTTIVLIGPAFGNLEFVFSVAPILGYAVIDQLNNAILTLQYANRSMYHNIIEHYFNHEQSNLISSPILEQSFKPLILLIVWVVIIAIMVLILIIFGCENRKRRKIQKEKKANKEKEDQKK